MLKINASFILQCVIKIFIEKYVDEYEIKYIDQKITIL